MWQETYHEMDGVRRKLEVHLAVSRKLLYDKLQLPSSEMSIPFLSPCMHAHYKMQKTKERLLLMNEVSKELRNLFMGVKWSI